MLKELRARVEKLEGELSGRLLRLFQRRNGLEGVSPQDMPTEDMINFFHKRTDEHIKRVVDNLDTILDNSSGFDNAELANRKLEHDASKFGQAERLPYIWLTELYRKELKNQELKYPKGMQEKIDKAVQHHYAVNRHHPEYHKKPSDMTSEDIAEMVSDWAALSQENKNSLLDWSKSHVPALNLTDKQQILLYDLVNIFENLKPETFPPIMPHIFKSRDTDKGHFGPKIKWGASVSSAKNEYGIAIDDMKPGVWITYEWGARSRRGQINKLYKASNVLQVYDEGTGKNVRVPLDNVMSLGYDF